MPRFARVVVPGCPHHITQRGNRRAEVFFTAEDRTEYLAMLEQRPRPFTRAPGSPADVLPAGGDHPAGGGLGRLAGRGGGRGSRQPAAREHLHRLAVSGLEFTTALEHRLGRRLTRLPAGRTKKLIANT